MTKPNLTVIEGGKVELVELPERQDFNCWSCGGACVIFPRDANATRHSLPVCAEWDRITSSISIGAAPVFVEQFLEKCGIKLLTPKGSG